MGAVLKPCKEYRDAPNPTPARIVYRAWVLSDQKGRIARYSGYRGRPRRLFDYKPDGEVSGDGSIWKPRRVKITLEFEEKRK